jgi:hypothetical protein
LPPLVNISWSVNGHHIHSPLWSFSSLAFPRYLHRWKCNRIDVLVNYIILATKGTFHEIHLGGVRICIRMRFLTIMEERRNNIYMLLDNINFAETNRWTYPMVKLKIIFASRIFERKPLPNDLNGEQHKFVIIM